MLLVLLKKKYWLPLPRPNQMRLAVEIWKC